MSKRTRTLRSSLLCRVALVSLIAGTAAGCSDAVERLGGGPIYTGGTANQREILTGSAKQPTYEDIVYGSGGTVAGLPPANSAPITTGSIPTTSSRPIYNAQSVPPAYEVASARVPVQTQPLAHNPMQAPYAANVPVPTRSPVVSSPPIYAQPNTAVTAPLYTGSIPAATPSQTVSNPVTWKGWTSAGGTRVPVRSGDTLHSMSRRFGVPIEAVAAVNGISDPAQVRAGQTLIIPTYVYSSRNGTTDATIASNAPVRLPPVTTTQSQSTLTTSSIPDQYFAAAPVPSRKPGGSQPTFEQITAGYVPQATVPSANLPAASVPTYQQPVRVSVAPRSKPYAYGGSQGMSIASISAQQSPQEELTTGSISGMSRPALVTSTGVVPVPRRQPIARVSTRQPAPTAPIKTPVPEVAPRKVEVRPSQPIQKKQEIASIQKQAVEPAGPNFRWPVRGRIISEFGAKPGGGRNEGVNLAVPEGTPVKAAGDGTVIYSGNELKGYGNLVLVRHDDGWVSAYAHNSELKVKRGETVRRGDVVGLAGATGSVSQPQVHFELRRGNKPVDPMKYMPRT